MRRVREWMAGGPPPHGLPSRQPTSKREARLRTALTGPPFSWIDHLIRPLQERRRDRQAKGFGGLQVDDQLELGGLLNRKISRLCALENLVHVARRHPEHVGVARPISQFQSTSSIMSSL